jgi:hypothetical protein
MCSLCSLCSLQPPLRVAQIAAGGSCCYAISTNDRMLYFWGITKKAGEAAITPQLFDETSGWPVSTVAVGQSSSILAATEPYEDDNDTLISFGPSPTFGELGYGQMEGGGRDGQTGIKKSSTIPLEVPAIQGAKVLEVTMGLSHSVCLVRATGKSRAILDALDVYEEAELDSREGLVAVAVREDEGEDGGSKKRKKKSGKSGKKGGKKKKKKSTKE